MSKVKIFTDSAADLPQEMLAKYDIGVVPLLVSFPDRSYADGVDLTSDQFYSLLEQSPQLPVTSQPSPHDFIEAFSPHLEAGRTIVSINLSSALSGTVESAQIAKNSLEDKAANLYLVDSRAASIGEGILVLLAAELAERGRTAPEIVQAVESARQRLVHLFTLDTMENLIKGGRISRAKGTIGNLLNIKPILCLDDQGAIDTLDKVRGRKKSLRYLLDRFAEQAKPRPYPFIGVCHADCPDEAQELVAGLQQLQPDSQVVVGNIGATIGTHTGKGCIAVFYFK
ncbi:MAG: DegV family protein [Bacillota bacterium]|jgi:DegV family protein with EDD domain